jgi:hypothetical protein
MAAITTATQIQKLLSRDHQYLPQLALIWRDLPGFTGAVTCFD